MGAPAIFIERGKPGFFLGPGRRYPWDHECATRLLPNGALLSVSGRQSDPWLKNEVAFDQAVFAVELEEEVSLLVAVDVPGDIGVAALDLVLQLVACA